MDCPKDRDNVTETDLRFAPVRRLTCGARHCYRCSEDCGVVANAWIMRDLDAQPNDE